MSIGTRIFCSRVNATAVNADPFHTCTKGVSLPSGPRFVQPIGRVAGLQVSLENSHVQGNGIALVAVISAVEFAILQNQKYISKTD